jgi:hypothetical protein
LKRLSKLNIGDDTDMADERDNSIVEQPTAQDSVVIEAHSTKSVDNQPGTEKRPRSFAWLRKLNWSNLIMTIATAIMAYMAVVATDISRRSTQTTEKVFSVSNRPYVGVVDAEVQHDVEHKALGIGIHYKNVGSVPAKEVRYTTTVRMNGQPMDADVAPVQPIVLFPQVETKSQIVIVGLTYTRLLSEHPTVEVDVEIKYKGFEGEEYFSRSKLRLNTREQVLSQVSGESN